MAISTEERKAKQRDYSKRRYHEDAEWRERKRAKMREYAAANDPDREKERARHADKMKSDPDYAARKRAASRKQSALHVRKIKKLIAEHKNCPCVDCGQQYEPFNMEFDHVRGEKKFGLGQAARTNRSVKQVLDEIAKCDVRCVLCHRRRHLA